MGEEIQGISIVIPVGPDKAYLKYLVECLESIGSQRRLQDEVILIDDMAHLRLRGVPELEFNMHGQRKWLRYTGIETAYNIEYIENEWLFGCATSWNRGVGLAANDLVLLMGSDDKLLPGALDSIREAYKQANYKDAWYNLTIQLSSGETTAVFNNAAAITKGLWKITGGFGLSAFASPDGWLISILLKHLPERLLQVREGHPLYWCRIHDAQDTPKQAGFFNWETIQIRDKETGRFQPNPEWAKSYDF